MTSGGVRALPAVRLDRDGTGESRVEQVVIEEPLELRLQGEPLLVTLRTPGHDHELVAGLLLGEGLIRSRDDLGTLAHCGRADEEGYGNALDVAPAPGTVLSSEQLERARRAITSAAGCGVCGRRSIDDLLARCAPLPEVRFERAALARLPDELSRFQDRFRLTGGLHAAGLTAPDGTLAVVREDVGRHNAVDKVLGRALLDGRLPLTGSALVVSGRAGFEIVAKAIAAGVGALVAVSAASSLAIDLAGRSGLVLAGFARGGGLTVYAGTERLTRA